MYLFICPTQVSHDNFPPCLLFGIATQQGKGLVVREEERIKSERFSLIPC